jgi:hypothetical protein
MIFKILHTLIFWIISWLISAFILIPCLFLSILNGFKVDYHHKFHIWWYDEFLSKM